MVEIHGDVADGFGPLADAFRANFDDGFELGAAFSLYVDGARVADLWGGTADKKSGAEWTEDTLALVFSTTKGAAAICIAMLVESGKLSYEEPVATYWPEFAAAGKETITLSQMMSHQAGLFAVDEKLSLDQLLAVAPVVEALAAQAPLWEPGSTHGYHALTYGWLAAEVVRRVDGRRLGQFFADEVAGPLGLDFWIGLPEQEEPRVAVLRAAPRPEADELELMMKIAGPGTNGGRALTMDGALAISGGGMPFNTREVHATEMPGANGITNARSLARLYAATIGEVDAVRLTSDATVDAMRAEQVHGDDQCLVLPTRFGHGFMLKADFLPFLSDNSFGHYGAGGSLGFADTEAGVGFGYVMNQMGGGIAGDPRAVALIEATRACL
ncbi:MAG: CubicO group peptidase (beta-lactamase class C family) [Acidimicrobiales bacterium]|jgi:CubicO group peptidase (beta-lactamase class C family)